MKLNLGYDPVQVGAFNGYLDGLSTEITTSRYVGSVVAYTSRRLIQFFEDAADAAARLSPESFKHMYEWGNAYGDLSTVGQPTTRLWKVVSTGAGSERVATFQFLPSVRPVPINPILLEPGKTGKTVRQGVHVFTWKARILEEGTPVTIVPISAKALAFVGSDGNIKFRKGPMTVTPRSSVGVFTTFFLVWWNSEGIDLFERRIRPEIENDVFPAGTISEIKRKFKVKPKPITISAAAPSRAFADGSSMARRQAKKTQTKYERWRGRSGR